MHTHTLIHPCTHSCRQNFNKAKTKLSPFPPPLPEKKANLNSLCARTDYNWYVKHLHILLLGHFKMMQYNINTLNGQDVSCICCPCYAGHSKTDCLQYKEWIHSSTTCHIWIDYMHYLKGFPSHWIPSFFFKSRMLLLIFCNCLGSVIINYV